MAFYNDAHDAMIESFEPKTPCRQFETRPCVDLSVDESTRFRINECETNSCARFPRRDQSEVTRDS